MPHRRLFAAFLCLIFAVSGAFAADSGAKLRGELPRVLDEAGPDELIPVSIVFGDQLTGRRLTDRVAD